MSSVYAIQHPHGFFKVGMSATPIKRYKNIQGCCPYELELVCVINTSGNARDLESQLHGELEEYNHHGEWFNTTRDKIIEKFNSCIDDGSCGATELQVVELKKSNRDDVTEPEGFTTANDL